LRLTAEHADAWNSFGLPDNYAPKNSVLDRWCAEIGRDPSEIRTGSPFDLAPIERLIARRDA
jgi:alkanesulfonate monooxygenase SsuD/methylene tetrahydromethanopterin reductase-like flavin-dependent oxidoreductase (luciferase family)